MVNFYNPYMLQGNYMNELQNMKDRIDGQIQQLQQQQMSIQQVPNQQPTNLTQNFQLAPNSVASNFRLVNDEADVKKEIVIADTYFLANNLNALWIKNSKGDIRIFSVKEIIPKDEKDLLIEQLQKQISELQGGIHNAKYNKPDGGQLYEQPITRYDDAIGKSIEADESSNVSIVPDGKTTKRRP